MRRLAPVLLLVSLACARTWDAQTWAETRPELAGRSVGRLGDATPYLIAADDTLVVFLCHWSLHVPLRVSLPRDASSEERELLGVAMKAWEAVVPRLHFEVVSGEAPIRVRFRSDQREGARTTTECAIRTPLRSDGPLEAELTEATLELRRAERDAWGRPIELSAAELVGSAAHELGHALGLQGHARQGGSVMVADVDAVRRIGQRLRDDDPLKEPAMEALYSVVSGTVIERRPLARGATAGVDALAERARARGAPPGVIVRIGDRAALVRLGPDPDLVYYLRSPSEIIEGNEDFQDAVELPSAR